MRTSVLRWLAVALVLFAGTLSCLQSKGALADGPGCLTVAHNGICVTGPGTTVGGETVGPVTVGGESIAVPNPAPVEVCYLLSCLEPGTNITTVNVPQQTVPGATVPTETVPLNAEQYPIFAVGVPWPCTCLSPVVYFYGLPQVDGSGNRFVVDWGDGTSMNTVIWSQGGGWSHTYPGNGVYVMSISIDNNPPVYETITCEQNSCS
jgi:hypothetical protein